MVLYRRACARARWLADPLPTPAFDNAIPPCPGPSPRPHPSIIPSYPLASLPQSLILSLSFSPSVFPPPLLHPPPSFSAHLPDEALPRFLILCADPKHSHRARAQSRAQILRKKLPITGPPPKQSRRRRKYARPKAIWHRQPELHVHHISLTGHA